METFHSGIARKKSILRMIRWGLSHQQFYKSRYCFISSLLLWLVAVYCVAGRHR